MPHLPFTPNHVLLVSACYPNSAALLAADADCRPNNQELSRLTYYAANRSGKINKLAAELEKRAVADARKARTGHARARATLLVTLSIFKAIVAECRSDLSLLAYHPLVAVDATLSALSSDLEVAARAASLFTAWTTYTNGHLMGVDLRLTEAYMTSLKAFAAMSSTTTAGKSSDQEQLNRTRLVGWGVLNGVVASEALYGSSSHFRPQISLIMDATVCVVTSTSLDILEEEAVEIHDKPTSPGVGDVRARPLNERRAVSIYAHIDGQDGPSQSEVVRECLRALPMLLFHCSAVHVNGVVAAAIDSLEKRSGWEKPEHCSWLAEKIVEWTQYQYRYAVPSLLVERLLQVKDGPSSLQAQRTMIGMVTKIFTSPTPLNNLSTSDIISTLITLLLRRVSVNQDDELLPSLVQCIASLGTHVYYADQIQDLAGELVSRLLALEVNGGPSQRRLDDGARSQALRCLLHGLVGLIRTADKPVEATENFSPIISAKTPVIEKPSLIHNPTQVSEATIKSKPARRARRTKVEVEVWQDTLTLLCDGDYGVRSDYADSLIAYLTSEAPKDGEATDADGVRRIRRLADGPTRQASTLSAVVWGDPVVRLLNAVHAYLYMLATVESLGHNQGVRTPRTPSRSSRSAVDSQSSEPRDSVDGETLESSNVQSAPQTSRISTRSRKTSMTQRILQHASPKSLSASTAASASDYAHVLSAVNAIHEQLPVRGLLTGVPMLLALSEATKVEDNSDAMFLQRISLLREVVARAWLTLGRVWEKPELVELATKVLPSSSALPNVADVDAGSYHAARQPVSFVASDPQSPGCMPIDGQAAVRILASCPSAQDATGMDEEALLARLNASWNIELALQGASEPDPKAYSADPLNPVVRIAPALMHIENLSLASLNQAKRGVGVTDLREALSGRASMSNAALSARAPSVMTGDRVSSVLPEIALRPVKSRTDKKRMAGGGTEVRDVLSRLGIGSRPSTTGNSLLRNASLATPKQSAPVVPPYSS